MACRKYYPDLEAQGDCLHCGHIKSDHLGETVAEDLASVFVFGSNLSGIHGAGAAKTALNHFGAVYGKGTGHYGNSYALPTKGKNITFMPLRLVEAHVKLFIIYAHKHPEIRFHVNQVGCGLAGLTKEEIAPFFREAPENCYFDTVWKSLLPEDFKFWGTFP